MDDNSKLDLNIKILQTKSKMDPFECRIFREAIGHEMGFTRSHPRGYYTLINNLQRLMNLIYNYRL